MKTSSQPRPPDDPLSTSVFHQLNVYALAASAAGVGMLALAQPADARIIYTKAYRYILVGDSYHLDLNHDGKVDFTLLNTMSPGSDTWTFRLKGSGNGRANGLARADGFASALRAGSPVGPLGSFANDCVLESDVQTDWNGSFNYGPWANVNNRYLGLRFEIKGQTHYGWARLSVSAGQDLVALLTGYAYETIPNKAIIAGKTKEANSTTVLPGSLGHLARGAGPTRRGSCSGDSRAPIR